MVKAKRTVKATKPVAAAAAAAAYQPKPTVPKPFNMPGDAITANKLRRLEERRAREQEEAEQARKFKAMPLPDLSKPMVRPFPTLPERWTRNACV
jgi:hypothetical protein